MGGVPIFVQLRGKSGQCRARASQTAWCWWFVPVSSSQCVRGCDLPEVNQGHPARLAQTLTLTTAGYLWRAVDVLDVEHGGAPCVCGHLVVTGATGGSTGSCCCRSGCGGIGFGGDGALLDVDGASGGGYRSCG